jgi:hypothetical protein
MNSTMQRESKQPAVRSASQTGVAICAFLVAFPALLFYTILLRVAVNIPVLDNYGGLDFMNRLVMLKGFTAKLSFVFTAQFNEYKLVFANCICWLQYGISGHTDFKVLSAISNGFVLLLAALLWKMFLPGCKDLGARLALFIPVSWLLFQLQYFEMLNWGGAGLQHITSLAFAFATIYLLFRKTRKDFCGALALFLLTVSSSPNGFLLLPIGLLILAPGRHYVRMATWLIASAGMIAVYSYHYNLHSSQASPDRSVLSALLQMRPIYVISFMGSAAGMPFHAASFVLGIALCLFFLWMARRGYARKNPLVSCCVLFLLLTAVGVAGIRSDLGLEGSVSSRYTLFSVLLLIFAWFAIVEEFVQHERVSLLENRTYLSATAVAVLFCLCMDLLGFMVMRNVDGKIVEGMALFEHPNPPNSTEGPVIPLIQGDRTAAATNLKSRAILIESIKLGVYRPPDL